MNAGFEELKKTKRVLFFHQFLAMGDAVFLSPVYRTVKDNVEGIELSVLTNRYSAPFVEAIPYVDRVHSMEDISRPGTSRAGRVSSLCLFLLKNRFDAIVLRGDRRLPQRAITLASKACLLKVISIGRYLEEEVRHDRHIVDTYGAILERAGLEVKERGRFYLRVPDSALKEAEGFLKGRKNLAGVAPVSNVKVKNWTPERTAGLIDRLRELSYDPVLFCADPGFAGEVRKKLAADVTTVGMVEFPLLMGLVSRMSLFVGVDTGLTHLAVALGVPAVGLYGPTSGVITGPYGESGAYIQSSVKCPHYRPLSPFSPKERPQECYMKDACLLPMRSCVDVITVDEVVAAVRGVSGGALERPA